LKGIPADGVVVALERHHRHQSPAFTLWALLFFLLPSLSPAQKDDRSKSLALKHPEAPQTAYGFKVDNSAARYWDEFMLVRTANAGDPLAQHELGLRYLTNNGFPADTVKAAYWIRKAAIQKLPSARYNYGLLLNNGWGTAWNPFEAYRQFHAAAVDGMVEAEYVTGLLLTDDLTVPRDYHEAYRWEAMAADSGYQPAREVIQEFKRRGLDSKLKASARDSSSRKAGKRQPRISSVPRSGSGLQPIFLDTENQPDSVHVPDDTTLTREVLSDAAAQLRKILPDTSPDTSVEAADSAIVRKVSDAAEAGGPEALTLIGRWYELGTIVKKDPVLAASYYLRAMRLDAPWAPALLWKMIQGNDFFRHLKTKADQKVPAAQFAWAELFASELDHQLTQAQALELLQLSAQKDFPPAAVELAMCYYTGTWVNKDRSKAEELLRRAERLGSREAKTRLAMIRLQGKKAAAGDSTLVNVVRRAAVDGSVLAQTMLAYCYESGLGVAQNTPRAVELYRKAAQRGSNAAYSALKELYDRIRPDDAEFEVDR
jgi:TPR repeat protein